ncbi:MAG: 5-formyltetrahydrofolate cyclo-ligase [Candidatus Omnitrophica bacterium]|nr:5-formyltetrahydrofolate cyclo-ligase [Candidatus Omnitrophota bacterium]
MKSGIRREMLKRRGMLGEPEWIEKSGVIQRKLMEQGFYKNASGILLYCHFGREARTDLLIRDALNKGKRVCVPFNDWDANTLIPSRIRSEKDIDYNKKIPQPFVPEKFPAEGIDAAVIPGVVFDIYGGRIGMGRGFFDRFLVKCGEKVLKVSIAFDFQVSEEKLPVDAWDRKVDIIITEKRVIKSTL